MKISLKLSALALAFAGMVGSAQATILLPNTGAGTFDTLPFAPGGTVLASKSLAASGAPSGHSTWSGTLRTAVVDGPETGINLDFYYQFSNDASSRDGIGRLTGADFDGFSTNVYQTAAAAFGFFEAGNQAASTAGRGTSQVVGFNFPEGGSNKIDPGETSWLLIIRTNAQAYEPGLVALTNGTANGFIGYQPVPVPEPETYAMMLAGIGLLGVIARRRRQSKELV